MILSRDLDKAFEVSIQVSKKNSYSGPERRQYPRLTFDTMVDIVISDQDYFFDFALNFSVGGFFFETEKALNLNQEVEVLFPLPLENWVYKARATPLWHYKNLDEDNYNLASPEGYGFKIVSFASEEDLQRINAYFTNPPDLSLADETV